MNTARANALQSTVAAQVRLHWQRFAARAITCRSGALLLTAAAVFELALAVLHRVGIVDAAARVLPLNALSFAVFGAALLNETRTRLRRDRRVAYALPAVLAAIGITVLWEWFQRIAFHLDARYLDSLLADPLTQQAPAAALTAVGFVLASAALYYTWRFDGTRDSVAVRVLTYSVILTGVLGLFGQAMGIGSLWVWGDLLVVAPLNGLGFVLGGITLWCIWAQRRPGMSVLGEQPDARIGVISALVLAGASLAVGVAVATMFVRSEEAEMRRDTLNDVTERARILDSLITSTEARTRAFAQKLATHPGVIACGTDGTTCASLALDAYVGVGGFSALRLEDQNQHVLAAAGQWQNTPAQVVGLTPQDVRAARAAWLQWDGSYLYRQREEISLGAAGHVILETQQRLPVMDAVNVSHGDDDADHFVLCGAENGMLRCFPTRPGEAPHNRMLDSASSRPIFSLLALAGQTGAVHRRDVWHDDVVAAYAPVGHTGLAATFKVRAEAYLAPVQRALLIALASIFVGVTAGTLFLLARIRPLVVAQRSAGDALRQSEAQLRTITDAIPSLVAFVDSGEVYRYANAAFGTMLGLEPDQVVGRTLRDVLGELDYELAAPYAQQALAGLPASWHQPLITPHADLRIESHYLPRRTTDGRVDGFHVIVNDITAQYLRAVALEEAAQRDGLTRLYNRAAFTRKAEEALLERRRHGALLGACYIDIDHFKQINDTHGHAAGDAVLKAIAMRLREATRGTDVVARLGGDEFAILFPRLRDEAAAAAIAAQLCAVGRKPVAWDGAALNVSLSIGMALDEGSVFSADALLGTADEKLYEVKRAGRGAWRLGYTRPVTDADGQRGATRAGVSADPAESAESPETGGGLDTAQGYMSGNTPEAARDIEPDPSAGSTASDAAGTDTSAIPRQIRSLFDDKPVAPEA